MMYSANYPQTVDQSVLVRDVYFFSVDALRMGVVLTPACDLAQEKAEFVQFCSIVTAEQFITRMRETTWQTSKGKDLKNKVKDLILQKLPRYHWLNPPPNTMEPLVVDFQNSATLPLDEATQLVVIAGLASPYREQLPARYASYMNRVGTPDQLESDLNSWADRFSL